MATTGTITIATGSYECEHCKFVLSMHAGDVAPSCPGCGHEVGWRFRDPAKGVAPAAGAPGPELRTPSGDDA